MANWQENLKNFDIGSISKINLNLDLNLILKGLQKRIDILVNILLILGTLFAAYYFYALNNSKADMIKKELANLEEKQTAAIELEKQKTNFKNLQQTIPQGFVTETEIIKKVLELAEINNVDVVFYTPTASKTEPFYFTQTIDFIFKSSFAQIIMLVRAIEKNKENLRIISWKSETKGQEQQNFGNKKTSQDDNNIKWKISVSSTLLNYEK